MKFPKWLMVLCLILLSLAGFFYYALFMPKHFATYRSPDKVYTLKIYKEPKLFSMPGDGSTSCVKVKLYKGFWRIKDNCQDCPAFSSSIDVSWHMNARVVLFAKARGISLDTGDCE